MRPHQAKDHVAAGPPSVTRQVPPAAPPPFGRPDAARFPHGAAAARTVPPAPPSTDVRAVDADVPAAVGRVLQQVLATRLSRAHAINGLFAAELADRVGRFTQEGGKRTRSQLVWWSLRACGGADARTATAALRIGAALELLQTCALVHDDVMDGAALRRGRPALHTAVRDRYAGVASSSRATRFGEAAAILAGDLALTWADDCVAETELDPWTATVVRRLWSDLRTEMVAGQYLDLQGQVTATRSMPRALRAACLKSALYSVERPLALGAAVAGADSVTMRALCSAGRCAGMAFQLRDDLDDLYGDPGRTGKPRGGDIREGKPTYMITLALMRAKALGDFTAHAVLEGALGDGNLTSARLDEVRDVVERTGTRTAVETKVDRLAAHASRHLDGAVLVPDAEERLRGLLTAAAGAPPRDGVSARLHPVGDRVAVTRGGPEVRR
jgi:geranylgeranyl diphosphate synthase type I